MLSWLFLPCPWYILSNNVFAGIVFKATSHVFTGFIVYNYVICVFYILWWAYVLCEGGGGSVPQDLESHMFYPKVPASHILDTQVPLFSPLWSHFPHPVSPPYMYVLLPWIFDSYVATINLVEYVIIIIMVILSSYYVIV